MAKAKFTAALVRGHKGVHVVIVPFDPRAVWDLEPVPLDDRREGWLVRGTLDGVKFEGWIGHRWGRYFLIVDAALRRGVAVGEPIAVVVEPTTSATALAIAREQAKLTTAPGRRAKRPRR